jgi:hypothetical protein
MRALARNNKNNQRVVEIILSGAQDVIVLIRTAHLMGFFGDSYQISTFDLTRDQ